MTENSSGTSTQLVDLDRVIYNKSPRLSKLLPKLFIRYLKRVIHQDDINYLVDINKDYYGLEFVNNTLKEMGIEYSVEGSENIPSSGRYIFASNHPLGGLDGLVFISELGKYFKEIRFFVNDLLLNIKNFDPIFIPVNKHGRQSLDYVKQIEKVYDSDAQILHFPAGLCSRKIKGKIVDLEWKKSFIAKAIKHKRDIVPVHFAGKNSNFFYNFANIRKTIGIKLNIEMIYLPGEMFNQKNKHIVLRFGRPISYKTFDKSLTYSGWAEKIKEKVYSLGN